MFNNVSRHMKIKSIKSKHSLHHRMTGNKSLIITVTGKTRPEVTWIPNTE